MLLILTAVFAALLVSFLWQKYSRFKRYEIKHLPVIPPFGNLTKTSLRVESFAESIKTAFDAFPNERFIGFYEFLSPTIIIKDSELIRRVTVKDFEHFIDHRMTIDSDIDPYFGRNLFSLKGDDWKQMRSTLSPAFTSSKIRLMIPFMMEACELMINALVGKINESGGDYVDIELKDLLSRYANDVIATCAFGLKVDSHKNPDNEFYEKGREAADLNFTQILKFIGFSAFPNFMKKLKVSLLKEETKSFFKNLLLTTIKTREEQKIIRPDILHLLLEARRGSLKYEEKVQGNDAGFATVEESFIGKQTPNKNVWTDEDLTAQAILFFVAGFETVSTAMSVLLYELAVNPDVQERLVSEIRQHKEEHSGKFDYNSIQNLTYLDMVVCEVLRRWPPAPTTDRICVKDYNLGKPSDKATQDYIIRKGEGLIVPVWPIHHDPENYSEPYKFDPERFSEENRKKIKPFTYLPFGAGPRNCIGSRFALCEIKVMAYVFLSSIEVSPCEKTQIPPKLAPKITLNFKDDITIRIKIRK